jgi:hypothetical protein
LLDISSTASAVRSVRLGNVWFFAIVLFSFSDRKIVNVE